jgi:hypothetical protein
LSPFAVVRSAIGVRVGDGPFGIDIATHPTARGRAPKLVMTTLKPSARRPFFMPALRRPLGPTRRNIFFRPLRADLADVALQRRVLVLEALGDVDHHRGTCCRPTTRSTRVRLEPFAHQFGEGVGVARVGIDRAHRRLARGHVVGVARAHALPVALGALGDDEVRAVRADDARDLTTQQQRGLHLAVGPVQECDIRHSDFATAARCSSRESLIALHE